jgi:hypothetical protein
MPFLTPGTYSLRMSALKFTGTCGTGTTSITLVVTDNDADGVPDVTIWMMTTMVF